jgi:hypothetical protein
MSGFYPDFIYLVASKEESVLMRSFPPVLGIELRTSNLLSTKCPNPFAFSLV